MSLLWKILISEIFEKIEINPVKGIPQNRFHGKKKIEIYAKKKFISSDPSND